MPVEVNIIMELRERRVRDFEEEVIVPAHTYVRFVVRIWKQFSIRFRNINTVTFSLYFENEVPNGFKRNSRAEWSNGWEGRFGTNTSQTNELFQEVVLAEGVVHEPGEYKYGIKATAQNDDLFDEDPFLIVIKEQWHSR